MVNATQVTVATIVCLVILIVSIALFAAAWSTLDVLEMGLDRNDFSKSISDKVYFSGRCVVAAAQPNAKKKDKKKKWIFFTRFCFVQVLSGARAQLCQVPAQVGDG